MGRDGPPQAGVSADAFQRLYHAQAAAVWNYIRYRLGPADADDLTAEVFTRAWTARGSFRPERGPLEGWLWAIARHAVVDALRRRPATPDALPIDILADDADPATRDDDTAVVLAALGVLNDTDRELVALRFGAGHTNRAIAGLTGLSEANVAQRLRRALGRLRRQLDPEEV
jgi:RNA polymerase sigma-70 factor (ECF subfamily)